MAEGAEQRRVRASTLVTVAGVALLLVYALPLLAPPLPAAFLEPGAATSFLARIFPGVPAWWTGGRLLALLLGATLLVLLPASWSPRTSSAADGISGFGFRPSAAVESGWSRAAFVVATLHALAAFWVSHLPPLAQTTYVLLLALPPLLLAFGTSGARDARAPERAESRTWWTVFAVVAIWLTWRAIDAWRSPRAADAVDTWRTFAFLVRLSRGEGNFLSDSIDPELPGVGAIQLFLQGLPVFQLAGVSPSLAWVQAVHLLWLAGSAVAVAALAGAIAGALARPVAAAVFLFSPFMLMVPLNPTPIFVGPLFAVSLALLVLGYVRSGSGAALTAFGATAGLALTQPALAPVTGLAVVLVALCWYRGQRTSALNLATASLSFAAALIPGLPDLDTLGRMAGLYAGSHRQMAGLQDRLFGQTPAHEGAALIWSGGPLDIPLAALLSPFAIARTPIRLWGDALFDPCGAVMAAVGFAVCLRRLHRDRACAVLLLFFFSALLPGFVSSYDQPSLIRIFAAPIPIAMLAAVGFMHLVDRVGAAGRRRATIATLVAIIVGGSFIFDVVNPRILRSSGLGLAVRALRQDDLARAALLTSESEAESWLYLETIATYVPERPVRVASVEETELLFAEPDATKPHSELLLWSPAVEAGAQIRLRLCRRWPSAALYTIADRTGLSRLHAARPEGHGWIPAVAREQWRVESCGVEHDASAAVAAVAAVPTVDTGRVGEPSGVPRGKDLRSAELSGADLSDADLRGAQLANAVLRDARLVRADLAGADLRGAKLAGADLTGADLGGAQLAEADLRGARLERANARGASFYQGILVESDLTKANLTGSDLERADLTGARLAGADLSGAELIGANLGKVDLSGAIVTATNLREARLDGADLHGLDLRRGELAGANLSGAGLRGANLAGLILRDLNLARADLSDSDLSAVDLGGSDLRDAKLRGTTLSGARLAGANLAGADLSGTKLIGADLTGADLSGAILAATDLTGASLRSAKLERLTLTGAKLAGVDLGGAKLSGTKLVGVDLSAANLRECDLRGADLSGADLRRARLAGADLSAAHLRGAKLGEVELTGTILEGSQLAGADLSGADLGGHRLARANLQGALLASANLQAADLRAADLSGADLREAALVDAKLAAAVVRNANLSGANLRGADLSSATLEGADIGRAYLDTVTWLDTVCPDGSRSGENGETCCGHHRGAAPTSCAP